MSLSRRQFLSGVGATIGAGAALTYILYTPQSSTVGRKRLPGAARHKILMDKLYPGVNHRDWIRISADGQVTAFTARNEIGQGVKTVIVNVLSQGLELPQERIDVVMGDTDLCPDDGPTTGSNATRLVVWSYWLASFEIRKDLIRLAAVRLDRAVEDLEYRQGEIYARDNHTLTVSYHELTNGQVAKIESRDDAEFPLNIPAYEDSRSVNVNADDIVTGRMRYTSDIPHGECLYGGLVLPPYHKSLAEVLNVDVSGAQTVPGVKKAGVVNRDYIGVVGDSFTAVQKGLAAVKASWKEPKVRRELPVESVIRQGRSLIGVLEHRGTPFHDVNASHTVVSETYISQYGTQVPIEIETALAERNGDGFVIHIGTQNPFAVRRGVAKYFHMAVENVRVISMPAGGAFGAKTTHHTGLQAAMLADWAGTPVKLVRSRRDDIQRWGRYKAAVVFDVVSAVDKQGLIVSQEIDIHQDVGKGTESVYGIPNVKTSLYATPLPFKRAIMRGTSYTQDVWALESHIDMLAAAVSIDPLEFRRRNILKEEFVPLMESCADLMGYRGPSSGKGHGLGFAMINHGASQLGVVGAEVAVDAASGKIEVLRLAGTFDIGLVINSTTAEAGVKGAMLWGLSWALLEEVKLDGLQCHTTGFTNYNIARFRHTPEIEVRFLGDASRGPRGCGEMPVPPTIAAISNAVYHATGIRFYDLPLTPEKVKAALAA